MGDDSSFKTASHVRRERRVRSYERRCQEFQTLKRDHHMNPKIKEEKMKEIETQLAKLEAHLSFGQREQVTLALSSESGDASNPSSLSASPSASGGSGQSHQQHHQLAHEEVKESSAAGSQAQRTAKRTLQYERALERKSKQLDELIQSEGSSPQKQAQIAELKKEVVRVQRNVVLRAEMFPEMKGGDGEEQYALSAWANGSDPKASTDHISSVKLSGNEKTQGHANRRIQSYQTKLELLEEIHRSHHPHQKSNQQPVATKGTYGPDGANLFVYGIPETYGENDLQSMFIQFGHIIHTKVFRDPKTGKSKGFGFISFDTLPPAQQACKHMNGFLLAGRKLQVKPKNVNGQSSSASSNTQSLNLEEDDSEGSDVHEFIIPPNSHMSSDRVNTSLKWLKEKYTHVRDIKIKSQPPPGKGYILAIYVGGKHPEQAASVHDELIGIIDSMAKRHSNKSHSDSPSLKASQPTSLSGADASSSASAVGSNGTITKPRLPFYDAIIPQNEFMDDNGIISAIQRSKKRYVDKGVGEVKILSSPSSVGRKGHIIRVIMTDHESTMYRSVWQEIVDALIAVIKHTPSHRLNGEGWSELVKMFKPQPLPSNNSPNHAPVTTPIAPMTNSSHLKSKRATSLSMTDLNIASDSGDVKQRKSLMIFDPSTIKPIDFSDLKSTPVQVVPSNASSKLGPIIHEMFIPANEFMCTQRMKDAIASSIQRHSRDGVKDVQVVPSKDGYIVRVFVSNKESKLYKSVWQEVADTVIQSIKDTPSHRLYSLKPSTLVKIFKPQPQVSESGGESLKPVGAVAQIKSSPVKEVASGSESTMNSAVPTKLPLRWLSQPQPSILPVPKASTVTPTTNSKMVSKASGNPAITTPIPTANSSVGEVMQVHSMNIESTPYTSCASMQAVIKRMQLSYPGLRDVIFVHNPSETDPSYTVRVYGTQQFTQSHAVFHEVKEVIRIETEQAARRAAAASATKLSTKKAAPSTAPVVTHPPATFGMTNLAAMITAEVTAQVQQAMGNQGVTAPSPSASFDINAFVQQKVAEQMELMRLTHSLTAANSNLPQSAAVDHGVSFFNHSPSLEPGVVQTSIDEDGEMVFEMVNPGEGESASSQLMSPAGEIVTPVVVDKSAMFSSSVKALPIPPKPISFDAMVADSGDLPPVSNSRRLVMTKIVPSHAIGLIGGEGDSKINALRSMVGILSITIQPSSIALNDSEIHIVASSQPSLDAVTREIERLMKVANKRLVRQ